MDELSNDEVLMRWLDEQIAKEFSDADFVGDIQLICHEIYKAAPKVDPDLQKALKRSLLAEMKRRSRITGIPPSKDADRHINRQFGRIQMPRLASIFAMGLIVCVIAVLYYRPAQVLADNIIGSLMRALNVTHEETTLPNTVLIPMTPPSGTFAPNGIACIAAPNQQESCSSVQWLSRDQAQRQVNYQIKLPLYLPPNYQDMKLEVEQDFVVRATATNLSQRSCETDIVLLQLPNSANAQIGSEIGSVSPQTITVGESDGIWIEKVPSGTCGSGGVNQPTTTGILYSNLLIWRKQDMNYRLSVDYTISKEEVLKIAESLR